MKIAVIASLYRPYSRGGAEVAAQTVVDELRKKHEVFVITVSPWKGWKSLCPMRATEDEVTVYRLYPFNIFSFIDICTQPFFLRFFWHIFDIFNIHSAWSIRSILQKEKPDIVMAHAIKGMGYMIPFSVKIANFPYIHTVHDVQFVVPSGQYMYGEERAVQASFVCAVYRRAMRILLGSPQCVIYPSDFLKNFYDQYGFFQKSKKIVLQNPIQAHTGDTVRFLEEHDVFYYSYLGQLEKHKGILFLLDAFQKFSHPSARLQIAGSGSCEREVRAACARDTRISFLGYVAGDVRENFFSRAHCLIVPSLCYENAPLVIGEALSRGIPVIAARIGGTHELIQEEKTGWTYAPADMEDFLRVLFLAYAKRVKYHDYSLQAKKSVESHTVKQYCTELLDISEHLISSMRARV